MLKQNSMVGIKSNFLTKITKLLLPLGLFVFGHPFVVLAQDGARRNGVFQQDLSPLQARLIHAAEAILDQQEISYAYGGGTLGSAEACQACNACIEAARPAPKAQLQTCEVCKKCSLDCSHFIDLVMQRAGLSFRFLTTETMLKLDGESLKKTYYLRDLGTYLNLAKPGDLLVYKGHVALLIDFDSKTGKGSLIHATSGRDIKGAGQGVQKETLVYLRDFRGPLLRVLRHDALAREGISVGRSLGRHLLK